LSQIPFLKRKVLSREISHCPRVFAVHFRTPLYDFEHSNFAIKRERSKSEPEIHVCQTINMSETGHIDCTLMKGAIQLLEEKMFYIVIVSLILLIAFAERDTRWTRE